MSQFPTDAELLELARLNDRAYQERCMNLQAALAIKTGQCDALRLGLEHYANMSHWENADLEACAPHNRYDWERNGYDHAAKVLAEVEEMEGKDE
jgi:hypothetical protein